MCTHMYMHCCSCKSPGLLTHTHNSQIAMDDVTIFPEHFTWGSHLLVVDVQPTTLDQSLPLAYDQ